ncbi:hypothetical protein MASR2M79_04960 [Aminivibrio sp.]
MSLISQSSSIVTLRGFAGGVVLPLAGFDAAFVGQVAQGDVELRDLDKFWDANGRFMIEDPQQITITQGDGKRPSSL